MVHIMMRTVLVICLILLSACEAPWDPLASPPREHEVHYDLDEPIVVEPEDPVAFWAWSEAMGHAPAFRKAFAEIATNLSGGRPTHGTPKHIRVRVEYAADNISNICSLATGFLAYSWPCSDLITICGEKYKFSTHFNDPSFLWSWRDAYAMIMHECAHATCDPGGDEGHTKTDSILCNGDHHCTKVISWKLEDLERWCPFTVNGACAGWRGSAGLSTKSVGHSLHHTVAPLQLCAHGQLEPLR